MDGEEPRPVYLHCDVDKMYYSVEAIESPALADETRAVIIGLDPRDYPRGVVTTANGIARGLGINSGMSIAIASRIALERGVEVVFVRPRHDVYAAYSRRLMDLLRTETPLLEQRSVDEAALDWRDHGFLTAPVLKLRERIIQEIGLSVSFGLAPTLLVAKIASEVAKSRDDHVCIVQPGEAAAFLSPLPVRALVGIGPKSEARLLGFEIATIGALAERPLAWLVEQFGAAYGRYCIALHAVKTIRRWSASTHTRASPRSAPSRATRPNAAKSGAACRRRRAMSRSACAPKGSWPAKSPSSCVTA